MLKSLRSRLAALTLAGVAVLGASLAVAPQAHAAADCVKQYITYPQSTGAGDITAVVQWDWPNSGGQGYANLATVSVLEQLPNRPFTYTDGNSYRGVWQAYRTPGQVPDGTMGSVFYVPNTSSAEYQMGLRYPGITSVNYAKILVGKDGVVNGETGGSKITFTFDPIPIDITNSSGTKYISYNCKPVTRQP